MHGRCRYNTYSFGSSSISDAIGFGGPSEYMFFVRHHLDLEHWISQGTYIVWPNGFVHFNLFLLLVDDFHLMLFTCNIQSYGRQIIC